MGKKGSKASKEDKEQPQWSEKLIQKAIKWQLLSPSTIKYHVNCTHLKEGCFLIR